jgi:hypothetical protein
MPHTGPHALLLLLLLLSHQRRRVPGGGIACTCCLHTICDCVVAAAVADSCQRVPPLLTSPASVDCVSITHQLADALPERAQRALWYDPPLWEDVDPVPCSQAPGSGGHNRLLHSRATHHWQRLAVHEKLPAVSTAWAAQKEVQQVNGDPQPKKPVQRLPPHSWQLLPLAPLLEASTTSGGW